MLPGPIYSGKTGKRQFEVGEPGFKKDSKGFLDKFIGGMDSYYGGQKEKSDTDKYLDFMRETREVLNKCLFQDKKVREDLILLEL